MDSEPTLIIGGPVIAIGKPEEWEAPDGPTAQRWADEVNARGGAAEILVSGPAGGGGPTRYFVRIIRASKM